MPRSGSNRWAAYGRIYTVSAHKAPSNGSYRCHLSDSVPAPSPEHMRKILHEERPDLIEVCDKYNLQYVGGMIREKLLGGAGLSTAYAGT